MERFYRGNLVLSEETYERVEPVLSWVVDHIEKFNFRVIGSSLAGLFNVDVQEFQDIKMPIAIGACIAYGALRCRNRILQGRETDVTLPVYDIDTVETKDVGTMSVYKGPKEQFE